MTQNKLKKRFANEDIMRDIVPFKKDMLEKSFLYDFQKKLLDEAEKNWLYRTDTGTGKTFVALHHFLRETENRKKLLIICPKSKIKELGWDYEIRQMELHYGIHIEYETITYGKIRNLPVSPAKWSEYFIIIDECHNVKNGQSQQGEGALRLAQQCAGFILLSATPVPQGYEDMFNYFAMFEKMPYSVHWSFRQKYGVFKPVKNKYNKQTYDVLCGWREEGEEIMKKMFTSFASYPLKKDECLDLPDMIVRKVLFNQSSEYKHLEKAAKALIKFEHSGTPSDIFESITSVTNFLIKEPEKGFTKLNTGIPLSYMDSIAKLSYGMRLYSALEDKIEWIDDFINDTDNNIIVFYNYKAELRLLQEMIENHIKNHTKKEGLAVYTVDNLPDTKSAIEDKRQKVIFVQIMKGGAALNLQYCNEVIYLSPDYKYGQYEQSLGRAYRNGQKNKVTVYHLCAEDSIDERIYAVLSERAEVAKDIENFNLKDSDIQMNTVSDYLFIKN